MSLKELRKTGQPVLLFPLESNDIEMLFRFVIHSFS